MVLSRNQKASAFHCVPTSSPSQGTSSFPPSVDMCCEEKGSLRAYGFLMKRSR